MKSLHFVAATVVAGTVSLHATQDIYVNDSVLDWLSEPAEQIDARVFVNNGVIQTVSYYQPYDFQNTRVVTNNGVLYGLPGWQFDYLNGDTAETKPLDLFYNARGGSIIADPVGFSSLLTGVNESSFILISAKEVRNQGLLEVSQEGQVKIQGGDVDLSRSQLNMVMPGAGGGRGDIVISNEYLNDVGVYDYYWGGPDVVNLNSRSFFRLDTNVGAVITTPMYGVTNPAGQGRWALSMANPAWAAFTNELSPTNKFFQAGFVAYNTNMMSGRVSIDRFGADVFGYATIGVDVSMTTSNLVTGEEAVQSLYLIDTMGQDTNIILLTNMQAPIYYRPSNYRVSRVPLINGSAGNATLTTNFFYSSEMSNVTVQPMYTAYSAELLSAGGGYYQVPGSSISNTTGRLEIEAKNLNLEKVRGRANGLLALKTDHLVGNADAQLQAGNYILNLASTNGTLRISNLVLNETGKVFDGFVDLFSAIWTNQVGLLVTNTDDSTDPPTITVETNPVDMGFHCFLVDASSLGYTQYATTHDLTLRSTNVVVDDSFNIVGSLLLQAQNITLNGEISLNVAGADFAASNAPITQVLTNNGEFTIDDQGYFGSGQSKPWKRVVNNGVMSMAGSTIWAEYFQNSGSWQASQSFRCDAGVAKFDGGTISGRRRMELGAMDLKFNHHTNVTLGRLVLTATNSLSDSGGDAENRFTCGDGFYLGRKPAYGDLLGTRIQTAASRLAVVHHTWPSEDRGVSKVDPRGAVKSAGWENNVAIGRLVLSSGADGILRFHGPDATKKYALYVDYLELQGFVLSGYQRGNLRNLLQLDSNVTLYFAYANVPVEELDGELNGQVRWDGYFAGPNSSVTVLLASGKTIRVNKGLRESIRIDSDGDGIANGYDLTPFSEPSLSGIVAQSEPAGMTTLVRWMAAPNTTYAVEFTGDLGSGEWTPLTTVKNTDGVVKELTVRDFLEAGSSRYYRVLYVP